MADEQNQNVFDQFMKSALIDRFLREAWEAASPEAKTALADSIVASAMKEHWSFGNDLRYKVSRLVDERVKELAQAELAKLDLESKVAAYVSEHEPLLLAQISREIFDSVLSNIKRKL